MHPVEHLLYFSCMLIHWIVPSHPLTRSSTWCMPGWRPPVMSASTSWWSAATKRSTPIRNDHYLHHKYFECNYADGVVPLDKWFGTFHDGSKQAQEAMDRRFRERARKQAEKRARREAKTG